MPTDFLKHAKRLPVLDWNLSFFGGHSQRVEDDWVVPEEQHQTFECIYVIHGKEGFKMKGNEFVLSQGDFVLIPPGLKHVVYAVEELEYFCFHFDIDEPGFVLQLIQNSKIYYPNTSIENQALIPYLRELITLVPLDDYSFKTKMKIQIDLSNILILLDQQTNLQRKDTTANQSQYAKIIAESLRAHLTEKVLHYVKAGNLTIDTDDILIARTMSEIGISSGYGCRIFKTMYNMSPRKYLSRLKLKQAQQMLLKPQFTINDIALALGYQNTSNFSRQFKRWTGFAPNDYRSNSHT